jgi:hypothetical protein
MLILFYSGIYLLPCFGERTGIYPSIPCNIYSLSCSYV